MRSLLTLVQIFNFADWIIAAFISGAAARIQGRDDRRTYLAVGLAVFFGAFAVLRLSEFTNGVYHVDAIRAVLDQVPISFRSSNSLIAAGKTCSLLFCWFAVTLEVRERNGITSGNVIRNTLAGWFDRLR